jgi:large subunit ribosomal protein L10
MARPEKIQAVADIKEQWESSEAVFLAEFSGLTVAEQQALRRGLREGGAEYKVVKMTLARRAADELKVTTEVTELLIGPTALAFAEDPATAAKALDTFAKDHDALVIKGMLMEGDFLSPEKVKELAALDSREVLLAKIAGGLAGPMTKFAGLMSAFTRNAASMFGQLLDRKEQEAPAPEPEADAGSEKAAGDDSPEEAEAADAATEAEAASDGDETAEDSAPEAEPATEDGGVEDRPAEERAAEEAGAEDEGATETEPAPEAAVAAETEGDGESTEDSAPAAEAAPEAADEPDDQPAEDSADQ